jgi:flagellar protein FlbD
VVAVIRLTRLNHQELVVNLAHIVSVEATPDTIVTLLSGEKLIVCESPAEVVERAEKYLRHCGGAGAPLVVATPEREDL